jgi:hypothetical protein
MSKHGAIGDRAARHALSTALPEDSLSSLGKDTDCFMLSVVILSFFGQVLERRLQNYERGTNAFLPTHGLLCIPSDTLQLYGLQKVLKWLVTNTKHRKSPTFSE